jgi:hypothetical protein
VRIIGGRDDMGGRSDGGRTLGARVGGSASGGETSTAVAASATAGGATASAGSAGETLATRCGFGGALARRVPGSVDDVGAITGSGSTIRAVPDAAASS